MTSILHHMTSILHHMLVFIWNFVFAKKTEIDLNLKSKFVFASHELTNGPQIISKVRRLFLTVDLLPVKWHVFDMKETPSMTQIMVEFSYFFTKRSIFFNNDMISEEIYFCKTKYESMSRVNR